MSSTFTFFSSENSIKDLASGFWQSIAIICLILCLYTAIESCCWRKLAGWLDHGTCSHMAITRCSCSYSWTSWPKDCGSRNKQGPWLRQILPMSNTTWWKLNLKKKMHFTVLSQQNFLIFLHIKHFLFRTTLHHFKFYYITYCIS